MKFLCSGDLRRPKKKQHRLLKLPLAFSDWLAFEPADDAKRAGEDVLMGDGCCSTISRASTLPFFPQDFQEGGRRHHRTVGSLATN